MTLFALPVSPLSPSAPAPRANTAPVPAPTTPKELQRDTRPLDMSLVTSRGVYCVCPDPTQGIVEMPINGYMVPDPFTIVSSNVLPIDADRIAAHAHRTSTNTLVAMGIRDTVSDQWATAFGWWFASYEEATLKAQSLGSVVYTS